MAFSLLLAAVNLTGAATPGAVFGIGHAPDTPDRFLAAAAVGLGGANGRFVPGAMHPGPGVNPQMTEEREHQFATDRATVLMVCKPLKGFVIATSQR